MTYQDLKLRAIIRLGIVTAVLSLFLAITFIYPIGTESVVRHLPISRNGNNYTVWFWSLLIVNLGSWTGLVGLIFSSPDQEVRFVRWTKRCRKNTIPFDKLMRFGRILT